MSASTSTDFRTIADFRKRHLVALSDLLVQVLRQCRAAGLVEFAHVAVDGIKLKARVSRHKTMSYGRMKTAEPALAAEVAQWLDQERDIAATAGLSKLIASCLLWKWSGSHPLRIGPPAPYGLRSLTLARRNRGQPDTSRRASAKKRFAKASRRRELWVTLRRPSPPWMVQLGPSAPSKRA